MSDTNVDRATAVGLANALTSAQSTSGGASGGASGGRKFGESLATFDPNTGKKRKFGESFSRSDDTMSRSDRLKGIMDSLAAKNKGGGAAMTKTEEAAKSSADSLKVIESELTRSS